MFSDFIETIIEGFMAMLIPAIMLAGLAAPVIAVIYLHSAWWLLTYFISIPLSVAACTAIDEWL